MKKLITFLILFGSLQSFCQTRLDTRADRIIANTGLFVKDRWIDDIKNDTTNSALAERSLMTAKAINDLVNSRVIAGAPEGSTHIETTGTYTIPDSVNNVILQYSGGSTITLPDPAAFDKREITIRNVSGNGATFNYSLVYAPGSTSNTLATDKWVRIKSDGTNWNVVQESGEGGSINITGGGGILIDNF